MQIHILITNSQRHAQRIASKFIDKKLRQPGLECQWYSSVVNTAQCYGPPSFNVEVWHSLLCETSLIFLGNLEKADQFANTTAQYPFSYSLSSGQCTCPKTNFQFFKVQGGSNMTETDCV
jgi:hypothetical protein